jgi:hypothetical protein
MRLETPDRVPVFCQLALGHYFLNVPLPSHRIWFTSEGFAEALLLLQRRYRFDGVLINLPGRPADLLAQVASVERAGDDEKVCWRNGDVTVFPADDNPRHYPANGQPLRRAEFGRFDPDHLDVLDNCAGYWWNTCHIPWLAGKNRAGLLAEIPDYFLRTIQLVKAETHGAVSVHGEVFSPFTHFMEVFGYEEALIALRDDALKVHALMERLAETAILWACAQARAGVDAVLISSAFAGGGFLSRELYATFVLPYERKLAQAVRAAGVQVYTHTCGRIGDRLDLMVATGITGLDTLDPPPLGNSDLGEAKRAVGKNVFIKGNMNAVALLEAKTEAQVAAEAQRCLQQGQPGGGYILSTACSVAPHVEPWKLEMLASLAEHYGRYQ